MRGEPPKRYSTSALISLVPRQVMLQKCSSDAKRKEKKKKKGSSPGSLDNGLESNGEGLSQKWKVALLRSISIYLEENGFSKTHAVFQSEAQIEADCQKAPYPNLEQIFCKFFESSGDRAEGNINCPNEEDSQRNRLSRKDNDESICDAPAEPIRKKKIKKSNGVDDDAKTESNKPGVETGSAKCVDSDDKLPSTLADESHKDAHEVLLPQSHVKSKDKKKKKSKLISDTSDENAEQVGSETLHESVKEKAMDLDSLTANASSQLDESNVKSKDKRKKKNKLVSDSFARSVEQLGLEALPGNSHGGKKRISSNYEIEEDLNKSNFENNNVQVPKGNADNVKKQGSKKRKRLASGELQVDNEAAATESKQNDLVGSKENKEMEHHQKQDEPLAGTKHLNSSKKRKTDSQEESNKSFKISTSKQLEVLAKQENPTECDGKETSRHRQANGNLEKNEKDGAALSKTMKTQHKHSAEPKTTVNAFQRVKMDEVQFSDERLQDNSYWAKHGADNGYGAKAQEILGQVRGRNFRHEKTKKKRGTYRGGQIDLQTHSIKFNYSDDEE